MTLRFKKSNGHELSRHQGKILPSPPPAGGGRYGASLETSRDVPHQDEPTDGHPVNAHKQMAGNRNPGKIPHWH